MMLAFFAGVLLVLMIAFPAATITAAQAGLSVWVTAVLPALFPYLICCQLVAASGLLSPLSVPFSRPMRALFRCPGEAAPVALLALLGGSPAGARLIALRHAQGSLTRTEATRLATLTGTVSPMFLLGTLPGWLGVPSAGWRLLLAHWLAALITGLLCARLLPDTPADRAPRPQRPSRMPARLPLGEAVAGAAQAMLTVGGCIVLGTVTAALFGALLPRLPAGLSAGLHALLEMAGGSADMAALPLAYPLRLALVTAAVSFGGLSILAQNLAFLSPLGVSGGVLLGARLLHAVLAAGLAWLLTLGAGAVPTFAPQLEALPRAVLPWPWLVALPLGLAVLTRALNLSPAK